MWKKVKQEENCSNYMWELQHTSQRGLKDTPISLLLNTHIFTLNRTHIHFLTLIFHYILSQTHTLAYTPVDIPEVCLTFQFGRRRDFRQKTSSDTHSDIDLKFLKDCVDCFSSFQGYSKERVVTLYNTVQFLIHQVLLTVTTVLLQQN